MPQPAEVRALAHDLTQLYNGLWQRLTTAEASLLDQWPHLTPTERRQSLKDLQQLATGLASSTQEQALRWTVTELPRAYLLGAVVTAGPRGLPAVDLDALTVLARDTYEDLLAATTGVTQSTKDLIRVLAKQHTTDKLVIGQTAQQAADNLARDLDGYQIRSVTYKNGARIGLADYTDMLLRTKSAQAYSTGNLRGATSAGVGFMEVFDGFGCGWIGHNDTDKANGTVRPVAECEQAVVSHPRCQRAFGARPDITSATDAAGAAPSTTAAQRLDQAAVDQSRELAAARRAAAKALGQQVERRAQVILNDNTNRVTSPSHARVLARRQATLARRAGKVTK